MENNQGWIRLHRKIMETPEWLAEPFTRGQAWVDLLLLANHKSGFIRRRGILIAVERGQVGNSEDALAARWRWSRGKVRRFLLELTQLSQIDRKISEKTVQKNTSVSGLIYITNYDKYQMNDTEDDTENGRKTVQEQRMKRMKRNKTFLSDSVEIRLSELLLGKIISRNPNFKKPDLQSWAKDIDLMIRLDNRVPEEIRRVIEWCQADSFWQRNILSTGKLRKQFDQLQANVGANDKPGSVSLPASPKAFEKITCPNCRRSLTVKQDLLTDGGIEGCVECLFMDKRRGESL